MLKENQKAISQGIKTVGVGRKGSKPLEPALIDAIIAEISNQQVSDIELGAFFGALFVKGATKEEERLEEICGNNSLSKAKYMAEYLCFDVDDHTKSTAIDLLNKKELSEKNAYKIGTFLFSNQLGNRTRALIASILRVRYETIDEYKGILNAMQDTFEDSFKNKTPLGEEILQISEPFDGVDHSYIISPLIAKQMKSNGYRTVLNTGRNGGPKLDFNLLDVGKGLNADFIKNSEELTQNKSPYGWFLNQADLSNAIDGWIEKRHLLIKRPFLSTLERFVNPFNADILIASAFHPPYGEKMLNIAQQNNFKKIIIIRNGVEGGPSFSLLKKTKMLASFKTEDSKYTTKEIEIDPDQYVEKFTKEEILKNPSLDENIRLINSYNEKNSTNNKHFNARVKLTIEGINQALHWLNKQ